MSVSITKSDQTAYVEGRSIHLISDILEYTENHSIDGVLFSADFTKAFDSVEHSFILATLDSFGFGQQFFQWMRAVLNHGETFIMINGDVTGYFPIKRGCRKGNPLSAYLFIICVEVLFVQVRDNNEIIDITIKDHEINSQPLRMMPTSLFLTSSCSNLFLMHVLDLFFTQI